MDTQLLYDYADKMMNDPDLSNQEKINILSDWKIKTQSKIGSSILTSSDIKKASEFLAQITLWQLAIKPI